MLESGHPGEAVEGGGEAAGVQGGSRGAARGRAEAPPVSVPLQGKREEEGAWQGHRRGRGGGLLQGRVGARMTLVEGRWFKEREM